MGIGKSFQDFIWNAHLRNWSVALCALVGLFGFGIVATNAPLQILGSLDCCMQKDRNLFNEDFRAAPVCSVSSGHKESELETFPDFCSQKALVNFS